MALGRPAGTENRMGSMTNPSKFLFNMDFSEPEEPEVVAPPEPEIPSIPACRPRETACRCEGESVRGRTRSGAHGPSDQAGDLTDGRGQQAGGCCRQAIEQIDEGLAVQEKDAVSLAFLVARRLCAHLIARQPLAETVALVSECLGPLRKAPHLVIRIAEKDVEGSSPG